MTTEMRTVGDRIALFTDEDAVYQLLKKWKHTLSVVTYRQKGKMVGADLYFDKSMKPIVAKMATGQLKLDI